MEYRKWLWAFHNIVHPGKCFVRCKISNFSHEQALHLRQLMNPSANGSGAKGHICLSNKKKPTKKTTQSNYYKNNIGYFIILY